MLSKKVLKDIQSLSLKKQRTESGLFLAEGPKVVEELLQMIPNQVEAVYALPEWIEQKEYHFKNTIVVAEEELQKMSALKTPNAVLAVVRQFDVAAPINNGFSLYLDTIQDPGNLGTIIRICDWFGIQQIVCSASCADVYNPKVVQATMGSIARVKVWYDERDAWLNEQDQPIYAATLGGQSLKEFATVQTGILLIGNESKGLNEDLIRKATHRITIPRVGGAESLNAAVATGIIVSHLVAIET